MGTPPRALSAVLGFALACFIASPSHAAPPFKDGEVILKFRPGTPQSSQDLVLAKIGGSTMRKFKRIQAENDRIVGMSVEDAINRVKNDPSVLLIEPNYIVSAVRTPDDVYFTQLWGMNNTGQTGGTPGADIDAIKAWDISTGSSSVVVAIIDTGIDYNHPDLAPNIWRNPGEIAGNGVDDDGNGFIDDVRGWDFVNHDNDPADDFGHGTHCAGTIGAVGNNGIGVAGVNWHVSLMPIKFLDSGGSGSTADAISAVEYATAMGVNIMSNSWGGGGYSDALRLAIQDASDAGILFVAAAGNSGRDADLTPFYPSGYDVPNVISVAATDHNDNLAGFSNYGLVSVDLAAPGVNILSTIPVAFGGYNTLSGTSMATPHVAGILALIEAEYPLLSMAAVKTKLLGSVDPLPSLTGKVATGGRANAFRALERPDSTAPAPIADLELIETWSGGVRLQWTSSGDDGTTGRSSGYELRYATFPLDETNFHLGTQVVAPDPEPSGTVQTAEVEGLGFSTTYYFAMRALDELGNASPISNVVNATTLGQPTLAYDTPSIDESLLTGATSVHTITLQNAGEGTLDFTVVGEVGIPTVNVHEFLDLARGEPDPRVGDPVTLGAGGPDRFGHRWSDSDQPGGPTFDWVDISTVGTPLPMRFLDENFGPIPLGFSFPWYGATYTDIRACTHGWLSFTNGSTQYTNQPLPNLGAPENQLAVFWDDLDFGGVQRAYYHYDGERFILEYQNVPRTGAGGSFTFEVLLYPNGTIVYQYLNMSGVTTSATVGLQNGVKDDGLTVAFNTAYLHDNLAIRFTTTPEWFHVTPRSGRVLASAGVPLQVAIDAADLPGGAYPGTVRVRTNDPAHLTTEIPIRLSVTGAPDIDLDRTALDFGSLFVLGTRTDSLAVTNRGTDALHVSALESSSAAFAVAPSSMTLSPGQRRTVIVTFHPDAPVGYLESLTLRSDDPDEAVRTVPLSGQGLVAPDIAVTPESFALSLVTGQSEDRSLSVRNEGGSDLLFEVGYGTVESADAPVSTPPSSSRDAYLTRYSEFGANPRSQPYVAASPSPRPGILPMGQGVLASMGDSVVLFRDDMEHGAGVWSHSALSGSTDAWSMTSNRAASGVMSWRVSQHGAAGSDALQSPAIDLRGYREAALSFMTWYDFDDCGEPTFEPDGVIVQASKDGGATWQTVTPLGGYPYVLDDNCSNPLALLPAYSHSGGVGSSFIPAIFDLTSFAGSMVMIRFRSGWDCGNCGPHEGFYVDDVTVYSHSPRVVSADPEGGTVPAGSNLDLALQFTSGALYGGDYRTALRLQSNDPDEGILDVPVSLHVTGIPDIAWSPEIIDFASRFVGSSTTDTLAVFNAGTQTLHVTEVSIDGDGLSLAPDPFLLAPGGRHDLLVTFAPTAIGEVPGSLTLRSDDPDEPAVTIPVLADAVPAPDIDLTPSSLALTVETGHTATRTVTVRNTGGSELVFNAFSEDLLPPTPPDSSITPPDSLAGPTLNVTSPSHEPPSVQAVYAGTYLQFGVTAFGEIMPFQYPIGNEHLQVGTFLAGFTLAYFRNGTDHVTFLVNSQRNGILYSSYKEIENSPTQLVVDVTLFTTDGAFWIHRLIRFNKAAKAIRVETRLENRSSIPVTNVVFKEDADWDVDSQFYNDWDYDRDHHIVYASSTHYAGLASANAPDLMDVYGWDDYASRFTNVDFPTGPVHGLDGLAVLHFNLGTIEGFASRSVVAAYGAADNLNELRSALSSAVQGADWILVNPSTGTVPAGGSVDLTLQFDPGRRGSGDYPGRLVVRSNDPDEANKIADVSMTVVGRPVIAVEPASLNLGALFVGLSSTDTLQVQNHGVDPLVVSGITFGDPSYTADPVSFTVPPFGSKMVVVTFHPATPGNKSSVMEITHNATGSPTSVALTGEGLVPPDVALDPTSISVDTETGHVETRTVVIRNDGGSNLEFTAAGRASSPDPASAVPIVVPDELRTPTLNATAPSTEPPTVQAVYEGTYLRFGITPFGEVMPYQYPLNTEHLQIGTFLSGYTLAYFASGTDRIAYAVNSVRANVVSESYSEIENSPSRVVVLVTTRTNDGFFRIRRRFQFNRDSKAIQVQTTLENLTDALLDQVVFKEDADWDMDGDYEDDNWNYDPEHHMTYAWDGHYAAIGSSEAPAVMDLNGWNDYVRRATVVEFPLGPITNFDGLEILHFELGAIPASSSRTLVMAYAAADNLDELRRTMGNAVGLAEWLSVSPTSGTVPAGGTASIELRFDPGRLASGEYRGRVDIDCNDPDEPNPSVSLTMRHTAKPVIAVNPTALDFGSVFIGQSTTQLFWVRNDGVGDLLVSSITSARPDYTADPGTLDVAPGESSSVNVSFQPTVSGRIEVPLLLTHNGSGSPTSVLLSGTGVIPPAIAMRPEGIEAAVMPGRRASKTLSVCNVGGSDLKFEIAPPSASGGPIATTYLDLAKGEVDPRPGIAGAGGADLFGHHWIDSDEPGGPLFDWIDVRSIGTTVPFAAVTDDANLGPFPIGFEFPFYGIKFTQFRVCSNGWISFTSPSTEFANQPLPNARLGVPENLVAALWDDLILNVSTGGNVSYYSDGNQLIVQYTNVRPLGVFSPTPHTFEIILHRNGDVVFQYLTVGSTIGGATVGIQNAARNDGLTVSFNQPYLHSNMAVRVGMSAPWLSIAPRSGRVSAGECMPLSVDLDAGDLEPGDYVTDINIGSDDPARHTIATPVTLHVGLTEAAACDFDPNTLNRTSNGRIVVIRAELPPALDPRHVLLESVRFQDVLPPAQDSLVIEDWNNNGIPDLKFVFDRAQVEALLDEGERVPLILTGEVENQTWFAAHDTIRVIRPKVTAPNGRELLVWGTTYTVSWKNPTGWHPHHADLYVSTDADSTWALIAGGVTGESYAWTVPSGVFSPSARVRVYLYDADGVMGYDSSDDLFGIVPTLTSVEETETPSRFALRQNAPNPFNPRTAIRFDLPSLERVRLDVFQAGGRHVRTLMDRVMPAGRHEVTWDGRDDHGTALSSGIYLYRIRAGRHTESRRMVLLK